MTDKSERGKARGTERRAYPVKLEVRAGSTAGVSTIEGYASVVEEGYEMWDWAGEYTEIVRSGSFTKTLSENPTVKFLVNHGGVPMSNTRTSRLQLSEDTTGLHMRAEVNGSRTDVRDIVTAIEDGDLDEMSFAFRVTRQTWSPEYDQRDIIEVDLSRGDVSVVTYGANPATSVEAMRAQDFDRLAEDDARALYERLGRRFTEPKPQRSIALIKALAQAQG